jgi:hypothetical protein
MIVDKRISLIYLSVYSCLDKKKVHNLEKTRGTAGRRSPALIHKWNNLTDNSVCTLSSQILLHD